MKLQKQARLAARRAYAPYSSFRVGAALLGVSGKIYLGANVENASYGLTICAERAAICAAVAAGEKRFKILVVYTATDKAASPCGACLQVLAEFAPRLNVISICDSEDRREGSLSELLPSCFRFRAKRSRSKGRPGTSK